MMMAKLFLTLFCDFLTHQFDFENHGYRGGDLSLGTGSLECDKIGVGGFAKIPAVNLRSPSLARSLIISAERVP